jgi:eukaryotic-like serine/threonine-protein kinase
MLAARLQHPHIVPVLSAGEMDKLPYFIMPFIYGESLRTRITRGPLSVRETVGVMKDVAKALAYAHSHGVVHRDIKPDNVLLAAGTAVVTDFGVAKALSASRHQSSLSNAGTITGVGYSPGTPAYMAPEQAAADPGVDGRADIYALGIVGYEMLAGVPPFHGRTSQDLLKAQLSETPTPLPSRRYDVPVALDKLLSDCLEKDPARRPKSASEVARALESAEMVSGTFATPRESAARRRPRRMRYALAAAALLAASVALFRWNKAPAIDAAPAPELVGPASVSELGRSIAVLPLTPTSPRDANIAAGATSELTNAVSQVPRLRVASQTAVASARAGNQPVTTIGATLGVTMLVEGSVQSSGKRVRMTLRLVKVSNDSTVWFERFEGTTDDIFALQDQAARAMVAALSLRVR